MNKDFLEPVLIETTKHDDANLKLMGLVVPKVKNEGYRTLFIIEIYPIRETSVLPHGYETSGSLRLSGRAPTVFKLEVNHECSELRDVTHSASFNTNVIVSHKEFKGYGLGSFGLTKLFEIAGSAYPDASMGAINLSPVDAANDKNKERRNKLYRNLGFELEFSDPNESDGIGRMDRLKDAKINYKENVTILDLDTYLINAGNELAHLKSKVENLSNGLSECRKREDDSFGLHVGYQMKYYGAFGFLMASMLLNGYLLFNL